MKKKSFYINELKVENIFNRFNSNKFSAKMLKLKSKSKIQIISQNLNVTNQNHEQNTNFLTILDLVQKHSEKTHILYMKAYKVKWYNNSVN